MGDLYYTISTPGEGKVTEKMSRFLSFAMHVADAGEAAEKIKEYQNKYHDSRHVCWAYMLGVNRNTWQLNDNGEPSGTAGKPILGQINSKGLTDVLVVVVRYFGGIKLGTSGLIQAYREAAREAIENAVTVECHQMRRFRVEFAYEDMDGIMRIVKGSEMEIEERNFDNLCCLTLSIREDHFEEAASRLSGKGGRVESL